MGTLVTVELPSVTGLKKDSFTNSFAIGHIDPLSAAQRDQIDSLITAFYNAAPGGSGNPIFNYISGEVSRAAAACRIRQYDISGHLDGSAHGSPLREAGFTLGAPGAGQGFPSEVAVAVTLEARLRNTQAVELAGAPPRSRPMQRYTGRIYLGPLIVTTATATYPIRPTAVPLTQFRAAVNALADGLAGIGTAYPSAGAVYLGVWSRRDASIRPVQTVSTDDSFDTQRRRGVSATARTKTEVRTVVELGIGA